MDVSIACDDAIFAEELAGDGTFASDDPSASPLAISRPVLAPGIAGSWWDIAASFGVQAIPVSIACNLIASWIANAISRRRGRKFAASMSVTVGGIDYDIEIRSDDDAVSIANRIKAALASDDHGD